MNLIQWILNKKKLEEQMEKDDRLIDKQRCEISKIQNDLREQKQVSSCALSTLEKEILKNKKQQKQIRQLKKELKSYEG